MAGRAVNVGSDSAHPVAVNGAGIAVGYTPFLGTPQRAFVWTRASGGVLLDDRVMNLPADTRIRQAIEIGEGGHILAVTVTTGTSSSRRSNSRLAHASARRLDRQHLRGRTRMAGRAR